MSIKIPAFPSASPSFALRRLEGAEPEKLRPGFPSDLALHYAELFF